MLCENNLLTWLHLGLHPVQSLLMCLCPPWSALRLHLALSCLTSCGDHLSRHWSQSVVTVTRRCVWAVPLGWVWWRSANMDPAGPAVVTCLNDLRQAIQLFWNVPIPLPSGQCWWFCRGRKAVAVTYREALKLLGSWLEFALLLCFSAQKRISCASCSGGKREDFTGASLLCESSRWKRK